MEKKMNSLGITLSIPQEIIYEIFSWLPVESLLRFKCVTKFCNSLVSESDFVNIHTCRSTTRPGGTKFFLRGSRSEFYTAEQREDGNDSASYLQIESFNELIDLATDYSQLVCANGLFCIWVSSSVAIFNPSRREARFLPNLNEDFSPCNYSLGFELEEKKYKVLSTTNHIREGYRKHWVFTLGIDKQWRETQSISPCTYVKPSVCVSGVIYQFVGYYERAIAAFDARSEKFEIIALWNASALRYNYELKEVKGKLAVTDYENRASGYFNLWVLEQTPKREWIRHIINFPSISNGLRSGSIILSACSSRDGEIVFVVKLGASCLCYDVTRKSWRNLEIKGRLMGSLINGIYSYVESLVPFG